MKKFISFVAILCVLTLCIGVLVACGNDTPTVDNRLTVTWYDGDSVLKTDKINPGTKIESWIPKKDNFAFVKWCQDKEFSSAFDFPYEVNESVNIYAEFKGPKVQDTRSWYLVGQGKGSLKDTSMNINIPSETLKMEEVEDKNTNLHKLTNIILYKGDEFVFAAKGVQQSEHGIAYFDKYNSGSKTVDLDGVTYFSAKDNNVDEKLCYARVNISGVYTLTLSTNPNEERYDKVTFIKTNEAPKLENVYDMHVKCKANNYGAGEDFALDETYTMEKVFGQKGKYLLELEIAEENYEDGKDYAIFSLINLADNKDYKNDFKLQKGVYHIMFDTNKTDNQTSCKELGYYIIGTFVENNEKVNYTIKENVTPKMIKDGETYKINFTSINVTKIYNVDELDPNEGIMHIMIGYGTEYQVNEMFGVDDQIMYLQKGTYEITFTEMPINVTLTQIS